MNLFIFILILLIGSVLLTRVATGLSVPYPSLLALGGALLALVPGVPSFSIEPSLALAIFVAPVLLDAAYDISLRDLNDNRIPIITLVVVAVGLTTLAVAIVFRQMAPGAPWAAAVALGAIVAPPDAAAATAVLRRINIPHRLVLILEGESLFNDATALLIFAIAVRIAEDGQSSLLYLFPVYAASVVASVLMGVALGWLYPRLFRSFHDAASLIVLQFCGTYGVWVLADKLHLSPILTIVSYGIAIARLGNRRGDPLIRVQSYSVWETVVFLTNVLAFTLIGLQLGPLLSRLSPSQLTQYFSVSAAILALVIAVRVLWVMTFNAGLRFKNWKFGTNLPGRMVRPTGGGGLLIAWSGMRGIVTLAAALALPEGFPERDLIQFVAFVVVLGTLILQGFTLGPLVKLLKLPKDTQIASEIAVAKRAALQAALATLDGDASKYADALRLDYQTSLAQDLSGDSGMQESGLTQHQALQVRAVNAARDTIWELRRKGEIGDDAYHRIEEALDRADLYASRYSPGG